MKTFIIAVLIIILAGAFLPGQTPESFQYQAVLRDASGNVISEKTISMRISILQGSASGNVVYMETHTVSTNEFGLITLKIGNGVSNYNFSQIDWSNGEYFIKIELDPAGGSNYQEFSISQLLSVPTGDF